MRITLEERTDIFGAEMLKYNDVDGVIGAQIHNVDSEPHFLYSLENMISVSELFEKNIFTTENLVKLLEQLIHILSRCGDYFLEEKNLVLLCDYMFYDEKNKQLKLAYLDGFDSDVGEGISKLLETFMDKMNHHDKELVFFVYGLHRISRDTHFNLKKLSDFIKESRYAENDEYGVWKRTGNEARREAERGVGGETGKSSGKSAREPASKSVGKSIREPARKLVGKSVGKSASKSAREPAGKETDAMWSSGERRATAASEQLERIKKIGKNALYLVAGLAVFAVVTKSGLLNKPVTGDLDITKAIVLGLVLVVVEGYLFGKEKICAGEREGDSENGDCGDKTTVLVSSCSDETVVLERVDPVGWYLNLVPNDWHREEIKVRKSPFFVGKDAVKSDGIIGDGEVSRVHAKIVMEEDSVFIIDQESTNGTFINGKQIIPWERCRVVSGDMIGISSIYYKAEIYQ